MFLLQFRLGPKAAENTRNSNNTFGPGTGIENTAQRRFKKFCSGDERLEADEQSGRPFNVNNDQLKALVNENTRITVRKLAAELGVTPMKISSHLKETRKSKMLNRRVRYKLYEKTSPF